MLNRLRNLTPQQRQLGLSVAMGLFTRVPGLAGVLFFLPRLKAAIGLEDFATMMAAIALGGSATFVMAGFSYVSRRRVGEAYSRGDKSAEADVLRSLFEIVIIAMILSSIAITIYGFVRGSTGVFYAGGLLTAISILFQQQDGIRAAYNEHYITATIQVVVQSTVYALVLLVFPTSLYSAMLGIVVIAGSPLLTSIIALTDLLRRRPYVLSGKSTLKKIMAKESIILGLGDGFLMVTLSFTVLYLDSVGAVAASAWFATTHRLFAMLIIPAILILLPVSSYVRLIWNDSSTARKRLIITTTLVVSLVYGPGVGIALMILSQLYVEDVMNIPRPGNFAQAVAIFTLFATIVVYKSYISISFVLLDSRRMSLRLMLATLIALASAVVAMAWLSPIGVVTTFAIALTICVMVVTITDAVGFHRSAALPQAPETVPISHGIR